MTLVRSVQTLAAAALVAACLPLLADDAAKAPQTPPASTPAAAPAAEPAKPAAPAAGSPFQIKVGDANIKFGLLLQPQADFSQNQAGGYGQNFLLRRARFLVGGQFTKNVFFFWETDNARLGNAAGSGAKNISTGFQTLDAVAEWRLNKPFNLSAGLLRVPTSRDALESSANEFTIDFNSYAFTATTALNGTAGRDTGVQARGFFLDDRLEYRASLTSGIRETGARNSFRKTVRVQYDFFDKELYNFVSYTGAGFGKRKIVAIGASYDTQLTYKGVTADVTADWPTAFGAALGTVTVQRLDGGNKIAALAKSDILTADGGLYFKNVKTGVWARYETRQFDTATTRDEDRILAGVNYYPYGNNFNVKLGVARLSPAAGRDQNQIILQLQAYYY